MATSSATADRLQRYIDAEAAILEGSRVRMADRELELADLAEVRKMIASLQAQLAREQQAAANGGRRGFGSALSDFRGRDC